LYHSLQVVREASPDEFTVPSLFRSPRVLSVAARRLWIRFNFRHINIDSRVRESFLGGYSQAKLSIYRDRSDCCADDVYDLVAGHA
jgi:hypothetical protein